MLKINEELKTQNAINTCIMNRQWEFTKLLDNISYTCSALEGTHVWSENLVKEVGQNLGKPSVSFHFSTTKFCTSSWTERYRESVL